MKDGKYVVKPWKLMKYQYGLEGECIIKTALPFSTLMERYITDSRIIEVKDDKWHGYFIEDDMLLGPYFEYGEPCLLDGCHGFFISYVPDIKYSIVGSLSENLCIGRDMFNKVEKLPKSDTPVSYKLYNADGSYIGYFTPKKENEKYE